MYLKKAGIIDSSRRGINAPTKLGKHTLAQNLQRIDIDYLKKFSDFLEFITPLKIKQEAG